MQKTKQNNKAEHTQRQTPLTCSQNPFLFPKPIPVPLPCPSAPCVPRPVDQVLQFLHGLRLAVAAAGEDLAPVVHTDDAIGRVDQEAAAGKRGQITEKPPKILSLERNQGVWRSSLGFWDHAPEELTSLCGQTRWILWPWCCWSLWSL